jgi:hypothetical protein
MVTLKPASGATVSIKPAFTNASNITLDGFKIPGATMYNSTRNIVVRNSEFTAAIVFDGLANANILLDHNTHNNIEGGYDVNPARIHLAWGSDTPSGVTVQNSKLFGGSSDGVQAGAGVNIINNEFYNIKEGTCADCHTDAIQLIGAKGSVVRGNYIHDTASGIVAYDGIQSALIEDNVIDLPNRPWAIELYADENSIVRHNTATYGTTCVYNLPCGLIAIDRKSQDPAGRGTRVYDNIATRIDINNGSTVAERHHNLLRQGATGTDMSGAPTYSGGSAPTSYNGFTLSAGSLGKGAASDGSDIGI